MIDANQLIWLVRKSNPKIPEHGQGWMVSMLVEDNSDKQLADAEIVVWNLDIPKPDSKMLSALWDKPGVQQEYSNSIPYFITGTEFRSRFTEDQLLDIRNKASSEIDAAMLYDLYIIKDEVNLNDKDLKSKLSKYVNKEYIAKILDKQ